MRDGKNWGFLEKNAIAKNGSKMWRLHRQEEQDHATVQLIKLGFEMQKKSWHINKLSSKYQTDW